MTTRALTADDTGQAMRLYRDLVGDAPLADPADFAALLDHPGTQVFGAFAGPDLAAMATLHLLPNMTQGGRPYALIENVVTAAHHRGEGHGHAVMQAVVAQAWEADAYKIMLMTGVSAQARGFYEKLGFSGTEKHAMTLRRAPLRQP